jgi:hypothetical protein
MWQVKACDNAVHSSKEHVQTTSDIKASIFNGPRR